jgi:DNA-binding SARP family transcriptional activator
MAGDEQPGGGSAPAATYWARFLGPFEVLRDGEPFARDLLARAGPRTLLKWLLLHPATPISAVEAARLLWPERSPRGAANRLHSTLHHLRRALEPDLPPRGVSRFIRSDRSHNYWFDPAGCWDTDVLRFRRLVGESVEAERRGDIEGAIRPLERAVALSTNPFLPEDLYSDQFEDARAAHDVASTQARDRLMELYLAEGWCHRALAVALAVQAEDPYSESAAITIARVHLTNGQAGAAAQHIDAFERLMRQDLGTVPGARLRLLRQDIRPD